MTTPKLLDPRLLLLAALLFTYSHLSSAATRGTTTCRDIREEITTLSASARSMTPPSFYKSSHSDLSMIYSDKTKLPTPQSLNSAWAFEIIRGKSVAIKRYSPESVAPGQV